jgi:tRNA pseudouridine38-40 synthase
MTVAQTHRNIRVVLQYDGTRYQGWQRQKLGDATIQAKLEAVLSRAADERINVIGASRTDAGVHAAAQVANFHTTSGLPLAGFREACDRYLPEDIAVTAAEEVPERFHARYLARSKRYLYRIRVAPERDVFRRRYEYHLGKRLDLELVRAAAAPLLGTHDFASFCASRTGHKSTVRELTRLEATGRGEIVELAFEAPAFLHGMARIIAGTLIEVGLGRIAPEEVAAMLAGLERRAAGFTAPPEGLCLVAVRYDAPYDL